MNWRPKISEELRKYTQSDVPIRCRSLEDGDLSAKSVSQNLEVERIVNVRKEAKQTPRPRSRWQQRSKTDSCMNKSQNAKSLGIPLPNLRWKVWTSTEQEMKINDVMHSLAIP